MIHRAIRVLASICLGVVPVGIALATGPASANSKRSENAARPSTQQKIVKRVELASRARLGARGGTMPSGTAAFAGTITGTQLLCTQPAENCHGPDGLDGLESDGVRFSVADDFVSPEGGFISELCWRGAYFDFGPLQDCSGLLDAEAPDSFTIRYYLDDGGMPGTLIGLFRQGAFEHPVTIMGRTPTGNVIGDPFGEHADEFEYTATHDPFPIEAGQCYWIEITNRITLTAPAEECLWLWETTAQGNGWSVQDDDVAGEPDDGYDINDNLLQDPAFCLDLPIEEGGGCAIPVPSNDHCADAEAISGTGDFPFENARADTDGFGHIACVANDFDQVARDVWFCWTAPCTDRAFVSTCGLTELDTRLAVYRGCGVCPPTDANLLACNDDRCGEHPSPFQSLVAFDAVMGERYLIRVGVWDGSRGGAATIRIGCGPTGRTGCPGQGSCCVDNSTAGCSNATCCSIVCECDPFCCDPLIGWDVGCATTGYLNSRCGAQLLCTDCGGFSVCGDPSRGDCCTPGEPGVPGCADLTCCQAVCEADSFCCEVQWDEACATTGADNSGNGAEVLCPELCGSGPCPSDPVTWLDPPDRLVDARQPNPPENSAVRQGIETILVRAPAGAERVECWEVCETIPGDTPNAVGSITVNGDDTLTLQLDQPLAPGGVTTVRYLGDASFVQLTTHPGNANSDTQTGSADVQGMIDYLHGTAQPRWGLFGGDVDHSGTIAPGDLLRLIDILAGAETYAPGWMGTVRPSNGGTCP